MLTRPSIFLSALIFFFFSDAKADETFKFGVTAPLTGDFATYGQSIREGLEMAKQAADGVIYYMPVPTAETIAVATFQNNFQKRYGRPPLILSSNAYDGFNLLFAAFKQCGHNSACVQEYLQKVKDYEGASGTFSINADGGTTRSLKLKVIRSGSYQELTK